MISILRIFKFAIQGFFRNFWLSVVTITMMLMSMLAVTLLIGVDYIKQATLEGVEKKIDITISTKPGTTRDALNVLVDDLDKMPEVARTIVITPEENRQKFEEENSEDKIQETLSLFGEDENPFTFSLKVAANDLKSYSKILELINQEKYQSLVENSIYKDHDKFISKVNDIADGVNKYSWYVIGIFALISIIVIFNTIRISIYTRRDEIMIMKLVGAGNWFVRAPFILEGIFYALISIIILVVTVYPLINFVQPSINVYFRDDYAFNLAKYFQNNFIMIFGLQFVAIAVLNTVATAVAIRKYLKV